MKRIILLITVICFAQEVFSQTQGFNQNARKDKRTGWGIHYGTNASGVWSINNGYFDNVEPAQGYEFGIRYNRKWKIIGVSNELNYKNMSYTDPEDNTIFGEFLPGGGLVNLNYISNVEVIKIYIGGFNINFGAQTSYLISGKFSNGLNMRDDIYYININGVNTWIMNDYDVAIIVGAGLDTKMGLYISLRSTASITPLINTTFLNAIIPGVNSDYLYRITTASFSIGYRF